jgi:hypothetical protein
MRLPKGKPYHEDLSQYRNLPGMVETFRGRSDWGQHLSKLCFKPSAWPTLSDLLTLPGANDIALVSSHSLSDLWKADHERIPSL